MARLFSEWYAREMLVVYEMIVGRKHRRGESARAVTSHSEASVAKLMEEDWFKLAKGLEESARAVQAVFARLEATEG